MFIDNDKFAHYIITTLQPNGIFFIKRILFLRIFNSASTDGKFEHGISKSSLAIVKCVKELGKQFMD